MTAKEIAYKAHDGQFRRDGTTPYISHVETVASVFEDGTPESDAAWLHDVIEDTDISADDLLRLGISKTVVDAVLLLTHDKSTPYNDYVENIFKGNKESSRIALKVKLSDLSANMGDTPTPKQIKKYTSAMKVIAKNL